MREQVEKLKYHSNLLSHQVNVGLGIVQLMPVDNHGAGSNCFKPIQTSKEGALSRT
jgi:hypothetical protein